MNRQEAELLKTAESYPILEQNYLKAFKWDVIRKFGKPDGFDALVKMSACTHCAGEGFTMDEDELPEVCPVCAGTGIKTNTYNYYRYEIAGILFRSFCSRPVDASEVKNTYQEILPGEEESEKDAAYIALLKLTGKYDRKKFELLLQGYWGDHFYQNNKTEIDSFIKNKQEVVCG